MHDISIGTISPTDNKIKKIFQEADKFYSTLYPEESNHPVFSNDFEANNSLFIAAKINSRVVACGGVIKKSENWAEIKRMYVINAFRRNKVGEEMLKYIVKWSLNENITYLRLETGIYQPEAISLYEKYNFYRISAYEGYIEDPNSIFFELKL